MTLASSPREPPRPYLRSGVYMLKRAVQMLGSRALPSKRTALGRALAEWRASLLVDLGGMDTVSTQQLALVELAVRTKLLVDSVDAFLLTGTPSLVDKRHRRLWPVVREPPAVGGQLPNILPHPGPQR